ncbi:Pumilio homolog 2 [Linum perenne]
MGAAEAELAHLRRELSSTDHVQSGFNGQVSSVVQSVSQPSSYSYVGVLGASLSRSNTPDAPKIARVPSPCPTPIGQGRNSTSEKSGGTGSNTFNGVLAILKNFLSALNGMTLSAINSLLKESQLPSQVEHGDDNHQNYLFGVQGGQNHLKQNAYYKNDYSGHLWFFIACYALFYVCGELLTSDLAYGLLYQWFLLLVGCSHFGICISYSNMLIL